MSSFDIGKLVPQLVNGYRTLLYIRWCQAAGLTLVLHDYLATFDLEVRYFWSTRDGRREHIGLLRALFLLNRYLPILTQILNATGAIYPRVSEKFCHVWFKQVIEITAILEWFAIPAAIICYRTCALYGGNVRLILALIAVYVAALIATIVIIVVSVANDQITSEFAPGLPFNVRACHSLSPTGSLFAVFIPPLTYDVTMCAAALCMLIILHNRTRASSNSVMLRSMAWHSVLYCCVIAASDIINMAIYKAAPADMRHLFDGIMFALVSISCNRLLLHLRELGDVEKTDFFSSTGGNTESNQLRRLRARDIASPGNGFGFF